MPDTDSVELRDLPPSAAGELMTLQRAAFVTEAQRYNSPFHPALLQTLAELVAELATTTCIAAFTGPRLVGAVRTHEADDVLHISRLLVAPDLQGLGIGTRLLAAAEERSRLARASLFTGHRSDGNLRLYRRLGYVEQRREDIGAGVLLVYLTKDLHT